MRNVLLALLLVGPALLMAQSRDPLPVPDLPGYVTLKGDFHIHTVFSDGEVWPNVRVREAWRDGLDVIAITEHYTYNPHSDDLKIDLVRPYRIAQATAAPLGIIVVSGVEIMEGDRHTNALFMTDANAVLGLDFLPALRKAHEQGAFVHWNHPEWKEKLTAPVPPLTTAFAEGLIQGVELVNGADYYPEVHPWIEAQRLTVFANSDVHPPIGEWFGPRKRPVTLVFAKTRDEAGVREALFAHRTAAWMNGEVWGAEEFLRGLWEGAVKVEGAGLRLRNRSAIPFQLRVAKAPEWLTVQAEALPADGMVAMPVSVAKNAPAGVQRVEIEFDVTNLHPGPGRTLRVRVPVEVQGR